MGNKKYKLTSGNSIFLDLIRGGSAQIVVVGHGLSFFGIFPILQEPKMQNIAVLIFFLLSGFLITYSTIRKNNYSFKNYFLDRFTRIYTAFIPAIIFVFLIDTLNRKINPSDYMFDKAFNLMTFLGNIFMLQDFPVWKYLKTFEITSFGSARPFWTLAIEWWIYLLFGYIVLIIFKKNKISLVNILWLTILSIVPLYNFIAGRGNGLFIYWIFGASIYFFLAFNILAKINRLIKLNLFFIISLLALLRLYLTGKEYEPIFAFCLAMLLLLGIDLTKNTKFSLGFAKLIKFNASYSFTLYLIHYSILYFVLVNFKAHFNPYLLFLIAFILSNVFSALLGYFTEIYLTTKLKNVLRERRLRKNFIKANVKTVIYQNVK